ncbi:MAG: hypothetical protein IJA61_01985 [Clostridia bacterium]|nr:hypothetical protein [Clostridia bacterium]
MSYSEYIDMFYDTQNKECPYRAFTFDIINSRNQSEYINNHEKFLNCVYSFYDVLKEEETLTNSTILLEDRFNIKAKTHYLLADVIDQNIYNPMTLGDMITYFVHNGSIKTERFLELFSNHLNKHEINFPFHFATGIYQTNEYKLGGILLYKGYMPQILEKIGKTNHSIISKDGYIFEEEQTL